MTQEEFNEFLLKAETGDCDAQNKVAFAYGAGDPIAQNLTECFKWHLKAAEQGQLNSMMNLGGWCYLWGNGTEKNLERALYWMQKVMDAGANDDWSKNAYAVALNDRACELSDSMEKFQMFLKSAELGNMYGQNNVANAYANKKYGVEKDLTKAFEWYLKSAEQGNLNSMMNVGGWCYLLGKGTEYNFERALYWMQKVMDAGACDDWSKNAYAMANIGLAWDEWNFDEEGDGLDNTKTVELVNKAVSLGNPYGYAFMAVLYLLGNGVEKNILKAKEFADKVLASSNYDPKLLNPSFDETWGDWFNDGWLKTINKKYEQQKDAEQNVKEDTEHKENVEKMGSSFSMNNDGSAFTGISVVPMFERKRLAEEARLKAEEETKRKAEEETMRKAEEETNKRKSGLMWGVGRFSVADRQKVAFSTGNLEYQPSTHLWRFAPNPWDYVGSGINIADSNYKGWVSHFIWGTGRKPMFYREGDDEKVLSFTDWGLNPISNGGNQSGRWRTLSAEEWEYLISRRTNANKLLGMATIKTSNGDCPGLLILPDNFEIPKGVVFWPGIEDLWSTNMLSIEQFFLLESAGAVFLPASSTRSDATSLLDSVFNWIGGSYWSSTPSRANGYHIVFDSYTDNNYPHIEKGTSGYGCSAAVRLVCNTL